MKVIVRTDISKNYAGGINVLRNTMECPYSAFQPNMILHMVWQWQRQNMHQNLYSQNTPHISPSRASCGVSIVRIFEKTDRVITALRCIVRREIKISLHPSTKPSSVHIIVALFGKKPFYGTLGGLWLSGLWGAHCIKKWIKRHQFSYM